MSNIEDKADEKITNQNTARQKYLENLGSSSTSTTSSSSSSSSSSSKK